MDIAVSVGANRGAVELDVSVEQVLVATVEPLTMGLASGQTQEGVVTVSAADNVPIGTTVYVLCLIILRQILRTQSAVVKLIKRSPSIN